MPSDDLVVLHVLDLKALPEPVDRRHRAAPGPPTPETDLMVREHVEQQGDVRLVAARVRDELGRRADGKRQLGVHVASARPGEGVGLSADLGRLRRPQRGDVRARLERGCVGHEQANVVRDVGEVALEVQEHLGDDGAAARVQAIQAQATDIGVLPQIPRHHGGEMSACDPARSAGRGRSAQGRPHQVRETARVPVLWGHAERPAEVDVLERGQRSAVRTADQRRHLARRQPLEHGLPHCSHPFGVTWRQGLEP
jgi:hypothetical protein